MAKTSLVLLAAVVGTLCVPVTAHGQADPEAPPYPPPGRLIDVGGWRLHLNCTGEARPAQPTVILESGIGDFSVEWSLVQPGVARFARVCSYDRAGDGWSELGPYPRTFRQIVYELHALLQNAGERGPYLLVGHSYGGWLVRLYQATYPADVAGMVLVEAGADDPLRLTASGAVHASELPADKPIPPVKTAGPLTLGDIPARALQQIRAGLARARQRANDPPRGKLPPAAQRMRTWALGQVSHVVAAQNPFELEELAALRAQRRQSEPVLGELPLIVITRGLPEETGPDGAVLESEQRADHARIATLSVHGKLIVAEHTCPLTRRRANYFLDVTAPA